MDVRDIFAPARSMPVVVVVATFRYRHLVRTWIERARRAGCDHFRIVCMDEALMGFLAELGESGQAVRFWDVLPQLGWEDVDAVEPPVKRLRTLTRLRVKLFLSLAESGCDFIHSDADALWRRDPQPWLLRQAAFDLLFSQGTTHPRRHFRAHHFTLCAGFFFARANARTQKFFAAVDATAKRVPSDQERVNVLLLRDPAREWRIERPRLALARVPRGGGAHRSWSYAPMGAPWHALVARLLRSPIMRPWANAALTAGRFDCMVTSTEIMAGRFSDGLKVGVIPMDMVQRVQVGADADADVYVSHLATHRAAVDGAPCWDG